MASKDTEILGSRINAALDRDKASNYGLTDKKYLQASVNSAKTISAADWSSVDSKIGTLNGLADAFMEQYASGSDIARAQNTQAAAAFARNAARGGSKNFAQLQNQGEQLVQQSTQNTAQGTQANFSQGNAAGQSAQHAEIQKIAADMQRTFANMEIARTKKQILDAADLADRQGIQAASSLQNDVKNNKAAIDLGIERQGWSNTLQAIQLIGGAVAAGTAVGSGLSKVGNTDYSTVNKGSALSTPALTVPGTDSASAGYLAPNNVYTNGRVGY